MLFGKPKLPIEPKMREWVDKTFERFVEMFGREAVTTATVITPTDEFFPDDWNADAESVEALFARICTYMGVPRTGVDLIVAADEDNQRIEELRRKNPNLHVETQSALGLYRHDRDANRPMVAINSAKLNDIGSVITTMAHELAHVILLSGELVDPDAADMEPMTDLLTVFRGFGLFAANSAKTFVQYTDGGYHAWSVRKSGYLAEETFGYALAVFAKMRGERNPKWNKYLKLNVRAYFKQSADVLNYESKRR